MYVKRLRGILIERAQYKYFCYYIIIKHGT